MKVLLERSDVLPMVTLGVTFRAGRADDPTDRAGLARVTARMVRRQRLDDADVHAVEHRLDRLGAELSEQIGLGSTTFTCEVLTRSLEPAVALLAELLTEPVVDAYELGKLLRQSKAALVRSRDDDALLCSRALRRHLFEGHAHGHRVLGNLEGLDAITEDDVTNFSRRHYTRANAIVHLCGDVQEAQVDAAVARLSAALPDGMAIPYPAPPPTLPSGRRLAVVDKPDRSQTQLAIGTLGAHAHDDDYLPLLVANAAFGGTFTSRMTREIRSERGWSYGASSSLTVGRVREAFSMWTAPSVDDAAECLALELALLEAWHAEGITEEELAQCRSFLERSYAFEIDTPTKRLQQKLERDLLELPGDFHERYLDRIRAVTRDEANAAVRRRISPDNLWIAAVADAGTMRDALEDACGGLEATSVDSVEVP